MDKVKNTIFPFIVGLLIGAIVTSTCFLVFNKTHAKEKIKEPTRQEQFKDDRHMNKEKGEMPPKEDFRNNDRTENTNNKNSRPNSDSERKSDNNKNQKPQTNENKDEKSKEMPTGAPNDEKKPSSSEKNSSM